MSICFCTCGHAEAIYRGWLEPRTILYFKLGILLEDLERVTEAVHAYPEAILQIPQWRTRTSNLSLLHWRPGAALDALRELLAYQRLTQSRED